MRVADKESNQITIIAKSLEEQKMDYWYSVSLGDGITSVTPSDEVAQSFQAFFVADGSPSDMAVFTRLDSEDRLHCELIAYFSPAAREVAKVFEAQPCAKPIRAGLKLLAGDPQCWSVLFAENA
jgi:hypothetical protein